MQSYQVFFNIHDYTVDCRERYWLFVYKYECTSTFHISNDCN